MKTDYIGHDRVYKRLKAEGAFGWTSEAEQTQVVQPRVLETIHKLALVPGSRILDMGCGTGDLAIALTQQDYEAHGIDIAPTAIAWANEKVQAQGISVPFTVGSVITLAAYGDDFFHLVVDSRCLHCIIGSDRAVTLKSIYRVLKPGGGFLVQTMCGEVPANSSVRKKSRIESGYTINADGIATRYIGDAEAILQELRTVGFEVDDWDVLPRINKDDQDDLIALALKPSKVSLRAL